MPAAIVMPKLGLTMTEGLIVEWKKQIGEPVKKGEILFVLETEKVTYDVESPEEGTLGIIHAAGGETVPVGSVVAHVLKPGEDPSALESIELPEIPVQKAAAAPETKPTERAPAMSGTQSSGRIKASPLAKKTARLHQMNLRTVQGTGPSGMVIEEDVLKAQKAGTASAGPIPDGAETVSHSGMRRAISRNMMASKIETAQTYMSNTVDAGKIVSYRKEVLDKILSEKGVRVSITDLVMKITAAAIHRHPIMNTRWTDQGVAYLPEVHMGMAMALDDGLIVPVIQKINRKSLGEIAEDRIALIEKGRRKGFLPDDISGSTFTVSAMGMFGTEWFTANINVPESAILAVGAIIEKPVAIKGGIQIRPMMTVTLTYDHRHIDGAEAGKFMKTLQALMEDPVSVLKERVIPGDFPSKRITVIGGGMGGYPAAIKAARMGAQVTLVEKDRMGGVCLNWGCIPTKSLLQSCQVIKTVSESDLFGVKCGDHTIDLKAVMARKDGIVTQLRTGVEKLLAAKKIRIIKGIAALPDPKTVQIQETGETISSDSVIIATGSKPRTLPIKGADGPGIWDSNDFLEMKRLPKKVAIIGGGVIGVEFAQILNRLGSKVTILEMLDGLVPGVDREIAQALTQRLVEEGIEVFTGAKVSEIHHRKNGKTVQFTENGRALKRFVSKVIMSVGRTPDLSWLDVENLGLTLNQGALLVSERMETSLPGVYGVGDAVGGIMLAHVAMAEGECAAENALGKESAMRYDAIPSCIYTSPEVAVVGQSEEEAKKHFDIEVGRFSFHGSGKALVLNETFGMVKIISEKGSGKVLGVHMIGPHATDMIGEAVLGMSMGMTVQELAHAVHPHPSLSEAVMESALSLCGGAVHMP